MPLEFRLNQTATGKTEVIATGPCEWQDFPRRAQAVVDHFAMSVMKKIDSLDERMWIASVGDSQFCISWDIWSPEIAVMSWENTPDAEVERLAMGT